MAELDDLLAWLRVTCASYKVQPYALYRREGQHPWPFQATDADHLAKQLAAGGHFLHLPKEPAALANILEVSIVDALLQAAEMRPDITLVRGTERGYPDLEVSGPAFGHKLYAVDIKVAKRAVNKKGKVNPKRTQSRITLYTGNTYFKYPQLHWPGTFRPFQEYAEHLDIIAIYTLDESSLGRIVDLELIVHEAWRIGSTKPSSGTREYLGAINDIDRLRKGEGEFRTAAEFYRHWRKHPFKIGKAVARQLEKLLLQPNGST